MPLISQIGSRSPRTRAIYSIIFGLLCLGAVTMIYPFLLMLSGSIKSETDFVSITPLPRYLMDDGILWMKYLESKYETVPMAEAAQQRSIGSWRNVRPPENIPIDLVNEFRAFRDNTVWPVGWYDLGHIRFKDIVAKNARGYRKECERRYGSISAYSEAAGMRFDSWAQVGPPTCFFASRRFTLPQTPRYTAFYEFKAKAPHADWMPVNLDGDFFDTLLHSQWGDIAQYNTAHGTTFTDYRQVLLSPIPPTEPRARADWETYVREQLNLSFIQVDSSALPAFQAFIARTYDSRIADLNHAWGTNLVDFNAIPFLGQGTAPRAMQDLSAFIKDRSACPLDALSVYGPRQAFEEFVATRRGTTVQAIAPLPLPIEAVDYADFQEQKSPLRWEFIQRNYLAVLDYLLIHGNGIRNTIIFCAMMILAQLLVNPLAAYALSRHRPPHTYTILLFCMMTMAFPAEVTMIPGFLLLKRFPLYGLIVGLVTTIIIALILHRLRPALSDLKKVLGASAVGLVAGYWLTPWMMAHLFGRPTATVSLLNTFWALVLPGMANGFSIFLLKGFFDSLPQELYEAAELDGASEWTKFWGITMSLSKPILAVLALGAFTAAYSEFMMALVIIPDHDMWTVMVWLLHLQNFAHPTVVYASLVVAAVPTFVVFLVCQNLIMRGIIVPTEK
jgi:ABC-type glycerol-3-phosphate transport system permease component